MNGLFGEQDVSYFVKLGKWLCPAPFVSRYVITFLNRDVSLPGKALY
jgi:hypothetical protein